VLFWLVPGQTHQSVTNANQDLQIILVEWVATILLASIVVFWERLPFAASVGLRKPRWLDILAVLLALIATSVTIWTIAYAFGLKASALPNVDPAKLKALPFALRFTLVLTAGFCEEVLFRGYAIERLAALTGKLWVGALAAIALFTLGHVARYGFSVGLLGVGIIAVFVTLLYVWRRSLWPCIAMHWIIDGLPLLLGPIFIRPQLL